MSESGIYAIQNTKNGKLYIGQTRNINSRKYTHFHALQKGTHHNKHLQRSYDFYGESAFSFNVLERCPVEDLNEREVYWISFFQSTDERHGYNNEGGGNSNKIVSERVREAKRGANNPMYGKRVSDATKEKTRQALRGRNAVLTAEDALRIKEMICEGESDAKIARMYNVSNSAVYRIRTGQNWGYIGQELNCLIKTKNSEQKSERDRKIKALEAEGKSRAAISKEVGCTPATVSRVIGKRSQYYTTSESKTALKEKVVFDFKNGVSKNEILKKYNIKNSLYIQLTSEAYNQKMNSLMGKAIELRKNGVLVKDIAVMLGYARTTISRWTKEVT